MEVIVRGKEGEARFECPQGSAVLHSAMQAGIGLPHECISGTCGSCKARLTSGSVRKLWPQAPAASPLREGEYLLCQCAPETPCEFVVPGLVNALPWLPALRNGVIHSYATLAPGVVSFTVDLDNEIEFAAGQFVAMSFPGVEGARCYSMTNADSPTSSLHFVVRKKAGGGVSEWLFEGDRNGAEIKCFGPVGRATFDAQVDRDVLCIAGGSGVAGMMSILRRAASSGHFKRRKGHLFFGVRTAQDAFFIRELEELVRDHGNIEVTLALSDETTSAFDERAPTSLKYQKGMVHEVAAREMTGRCETVVAFVAGPGLAVSAALRVLLLQLKVPAAFIKYDKFG